MRARLVAESIVCALGLAVLAWAWRADAAWCERHVVLTWWTHDQVASVIARNWRRGAIVLGALLLVVVRPLVGRWVARAGGREALGAALRYGVALAMALGASEVGLRYSRRHGLINPAAVETRIGEPHPRYGWLYVASRSTVVPTAGRDIEYAIDAAHDRARAIDDTPDRARPTLLFAGESIAAGHGLAWDESLPALVGKATDLQVVDVAVHAYGCDQTFLRVVDALPKLDRPVAVITLFIPMMIWRMTRDDHPHLALIPALSDPARVDPMLVPAASFWRDMQVARLWRDLVRYDDDAPVTLAARIFRETDRRARERGARAIFVRPTFGDPAAPGEETLVDALFTAQGLTLVGADVGDDLLDGDPHPNVRATRRLADAVIAALGSPTAVR